MTARTVKYPGRLGRPMSEKEFHAERTASSAEGMVAKFGMRATLNWIDQRELELLIELMEYYRIHPSDPNCSLSLAVSLARDHVPAFRFLSAGDHQGFTASYPYMLQREGPDGSAYGPTITTNSCWPQLLSFT